MSHNRHTFDIKCPLSVTHRHQSVPKFGRQKKRMSRKWFRTAKLLSSRADLCLLVRQLFLHWKKKCFYVLKFESPVVIIIIFFFYLFVSLFQDGSQHNRKLWTVKWGGNRWNHRNIFWISHNVCVEKLKKLRNSHREYITFEEPRH